MIDTNHTLHRARRVLVDGDYEVDLDECADSANVPDWIAQVAGKGWATPEVVGNLVIAMNELLELQQHVCGSGRDHRSDAKRHLTKQRSGSRP